MPPAELPNVQVPDVDRCVQKYIYEKSFSCAAVVASVAGNVFHRATYGTLVQPPPMQKAAAGTLFDLGGLTEALATSVGALWLVSRSRLDIGAPLSKTLPELRDPQFESVNIDMLLDHTAGFPGLRTYWQELAEHDARAPKAEAQLGTAKGLPRLKELVGATRLEAKPGSRMVFSPPGVMVLGWVLEHATGLPLDEFLLREVYRPLGIDNELFFVRLDDARKRQRLSNRSFAATGKCPQRDRVLQGEVEDLNAYAAGGVAGHAGLFGTAEAVWKLTHALWAGYKGVDRTFLAGTVRRFWTRSRRVRGTTYALGWDTPNLAEPVVGKRFSRNAVGQVSTTGCSVWIDLNTDVIAVVLTNACHPTLEGKTEPLLKFRQRVHEIIAKEGESLPSDGGNPGAKGPGH